MKSIYLISAVLMAFSACTPVRNREVMEQGIRQAGSFSLYPRSKGLLDPMVYRK